MILGTVVETAKLLSRQCISHGLFKIKSLRVIRKAEKKDDSRKSRISGSDTNRISVDIGVRYYKSSHISFSPSVLQINDELQRQLRAISPPLEIAFKRQLPVGLRIRDPQLTCGHSTHLAPPDSQWRCREWGGRGKRFYRLRPVGRPDWWSGRSNGWGFLQSVLRRLR